MAGQDGAPNSGHSDGGLFGKFMHTVIDNMGPKLQEAIAHVEKPSADVTGVSLKGLTLDAATLAFDVGVKNPYPVALPLLDLNYKIHSNGAQLMAGTLPSAGSIDPLSTRTLQIPAAFTFATLYKLVQGLRPGALIPYVLEASLGIHAPVIGRFDIPFSKQGQLPIPAVPEVDVESIAWKDLSLENATANMRLNIGNKNDFDLGLKQLAYDLSLGGHPVVKTSISKPTTLTKGQKGVLDIPLSFNPMDLGMAVFNMISGHGAGYGLAGSMDVDTPFGPLHLPFNKIGETLFGGSGTGKKEVDPSMLAQGNAGRAPESTVQVDPNARGVHVDESGTDVTLGNSGVISTG